MKPAFIWIVNNKTQDEFVQQTQDWLDFAKKHRFLIKSFLNIDSMTDSEIIESVIKEMNGQLTTLIGFESYKVISNSISTAIQIVSEFSNAGGKIFNLSYAIHSLVEIPRDQIFSMLKIDDFLFLEEDDIPFLLSYSQKDVTITDLIFFLCEIKNTIEQSDLDNFSSSAIVDEIRHAMIFAQLIENKTTTE